MYKVRQNACRKHIAQRLLRRPLQKPFKTAPENTDEGEHSENADIDQMGDALVVRVGESRSGPFLLQPRRQLRYAVAIDGKAVLSHAEETFPERERPVDGKTIPPGSPPGAPPMAVKQKYGIF